jgi:hypothetical protein
MLDLSDGVVGDELKDSKLEVPRLNFIAQGVLPCWDGVYFISGRLPSKVPLLGPPHPRCNAVLSQRSRIELSN